LAGAEAAGPRGMIGIVMMRKSLHYTRSTTLIARIIEGWLT
jgi:hypothetical protein